MRHHKKAKGNTVEIDREGCRCIDREMKIEWRVIEESSKDRKNNNVEKDGEKHRHPKGTLKLR